MNKTQERVVKVLERMVEMCKLEADYAEEFSDALEPMLTEFHYDDGFGTEGALDPRGDFRDGEWSMNHVQGVDDINES